jgi:hypothetical protein
MEPMAVQAEMKGMVMEAVIVAVTMMKLMLLGFLHLSLALKTGCLQPTT